MRQTELAGRLGKPQSFIAKYETGERRLDVIELIAVLRALGEDPVGFVGRSDGEDRTTIAHHPGCHIRSRLPLSRVVQTAGINLISSAMCHELTPGAHLPGTPAITTLSAYCCIAAPTYGK
jgi:transcriptional regulator with XRE-family HTH domain